MTRRLCAILAADVVGYSRMMGADQQDAIAVVQALRRDVLRPVLEAHDGDILNSMGDGWLIAFSSAVSAVNAAMQIQDRLAEAGPIRLRIGIHIGDVTRHGDEVYGDGINVAARLETEAPEGGILISDAVHASLDGTLAPSFDEAGTRRLKNIDRPVVTWQRGETTVQASARADRRVAQSAFPHLAICPVQISDPRGEIADIAQALGEDLRTVYGGFTWLVSAVADAPPAGWYALRPVLRTRGDRLRLETRLISPEGDTIWTHKSDTTLDDSFDWQDAIVTEIGAGTAELIFEQANHQFARIPFHDLTAEQCYLMGIFSWRTFSPEAFSRTVGYHQRAFTLRPDFADAYAEAIAVLNASRSMGENELMRQYRAQLPDWIEAARPMAAGHALLTYSIGVAEYQQTRRIAPLNRVIAEVLRLAPFDFRILGYCGWGYLWSGQPESALDCFLKSMRLGKLGAFEVAGYGGAATSCFLLERDAQALELCDAGLALSDSYSTLFRVKAAILVQKGELDEARRLMARFRELAPSATIAEWRAKNDYAGHPGAERYFAAARQAGMPEA